MTHPARELKNRGLRPLKFLGQNFLNDPVLALAIVESAGLTGEDTVVEIGPGLGAITGFLAEKAGKVIAVEIDKGLAAGLRDDFEINPKVSVLHEDFLKVDIQKLAEEAGRPLDVVGNLPYSITSPVLFRLFENGRVIRSATLMVQREVGSRIVAGPGNKIYGILSVIAQYYASVRLILNAPPTSFHPRPKVDSTVLGFDFSKPFLPRAQDDLFLQRVVKAAFSMRRKMMKNCLAKSEFIHAQEVDVVRALEECGLNVKIRAEEVSLEEFVRLSDILLRMNQQA